MYVIMEEANSPPPACLRISHKLPVGVREDLFDSTFLKKEFLEWLHPQKSWQLHLRGGPGRGKTTLAALFTKLLYDYTRFPVATVFVQRGARENTSLEVAHLTDLINEQLHPVLPTHDRKNVEGTLHEESLKELNDTLLVLLSQSPVRFVILDGFDDLPLPVQDDVETYLEGLQNAKILITRRVAKFDKRAESHWYCDSCGNDDVSDPLNLYWECELCIQSLVKKNQGPIQPEQRWILCYNCRGRGINCGKPGHEMSLFEPYRHVNLLVQPDPTSLKGFIYQDLHREYGAYADAGMSNNAVSSAIIQHFDHRVYCDITNTCLRLDHVREQANLQQLTAKKDRLPSTIVAYYDGELEAIEPQEPQARELVMIALTAIVPRDLSRSHDQDSNILEVENVLKMCDGAIVAEHDVTWPNVVKVLRAARGLLFRKNERIMCYHPSLIRYIEEDYNWDLIAAYEKLNAMRELIDPDTRLADSDAFSDRDFSVSPSEDFETSSESEEFESSSESEDDDFVVTRHSPPVLSRGTSTDTETSLAMSASSTISHNSSVSSVDSQDQMGKFRELEIRKFHQSAHENASYTRTVCNYCRNSILECRALHGFHWENNTELASYPGPSCPFCSAIFTDRKAISVREQDGELVSNCLNSYWSLRTRAKISNVQSILSITFQSASQYRLPKRRFHMISEVDSNHPPVAEQLGSSTRLHDTGDQIRSWISTCDDTHSHCKQAGTESYVPKRLVDIDTGSKDIVRVVDTAQNGIRAPYVTLSHCWGQTHFLVLLRKNEAQLMGEGIRMSDLTINFQHAIEVARFLGMKYIWIDSLCIVQGPGGDFGEQGQYMHKVYRYTYCNIVAADSADSEGGLFRKRDPRDIVPPIYEADEDSRLERGTWRVFDENFWLKELLGSKIYTRAWVFQGTYWITDLLMNAFQVKQRLRVSLERMLSPRLLHFTKSQIFWDCSTRSACESIPNGLPHAIDRFAASNRHWRGRLNEITGDRPSIRGPNDDSLESLWKEALLRYTGCELTNQSDKRMAIWSVAKLIRDGLQHDDPGEEYGGGLWARRLHEQLAWRAESPSEGARLDDLQLGSPSWSWASVKGPINAQERLVSNRSYIVESHEGKPLSFHVKNEDRNKEPELEAFGSIEMCGYLGESTIIVNPSSRAYKLSLAERVFDEIHVFPDEIPVNGSQSMECHFAILAASEDRRGSQATYSGIGLVLVSLDLYEAQQRAKRAGLENLFTEMKGMSDVEEHQVKELKHRFEACSAWCQRLLQMRNQQAKPESHFRRIGALQFRDISAETWGKIAERERSKFWLD